MVGIMALRSATRTPAARMRVALYNTPALLLVAPLAAARAVTLRVAAAAARAVHHGELLRHGEPRAQPHAHRVPNPLHLRAHVTVWQHAGVAGASQHQRRERRCVLLPMRAWAGTRTISRQNRAAGHDSAP